MKVISLCDYTGIFVQPWADAGYDCYIVDPQHSDFDTTNNITRVPLTLEAAEDIFGMLLADDDIAFVAGWPPCTDLAVSGASRFKGKFEKDPDFQEKAMQVVMQCANFGEASKAPWFLENPVSVISSLWRKPDHIFHPWEYGGYLPEDDEHPQYPGYIPARDAYNKKTCYWTGGF